MVQNMRWGALAAIAMITCLTGLAALATMPPGIFKEEFNGAPAAPTAWSSSSLDVIVHHRDDSAPHEMEADHDVMCGPPPGKHHIHTMNQAVFLCRDHLMTAIDSSESGYAVIYLTPTAVLDWSEKPARFAFDVSTARSTKRDWIDVWLTPWDQNMVLPSDPGTPDLSGPPAKAIHLQLTNRFAWQVTAYPEGAKISRNEWMDIPVPFSKLQRDRFTIAVEKGHLTIFYTNAASKQNRVVERVQLPANLGFNQAVVQIGHHSYTPAKDCEDSKIGSCGPNTWHWDNISLEPARAFSVRGAPDISKSGSVPLGSGWLRFAARGATEIDWGSGWTPVRPVNRAEPNAGGFASYFLPIPTAAKQILVRGEPTWAGEWKAKQIGVWTKAD